MFVIRWCWCQIAQCWQINWPDQHWSHNGFNLFLDYRLIELIYSSLIDFKSSALLIWRHVTLQIWLRLFSVMGLGLGEGTVCTLKKTFMSMESPRKHGNLTCVCVHVCLSHVSWQLLNDLYGVICAWCPSAVGSNSMYSLWSRLLDSFVSFRYCFRSGLISSSLQSVINLTRLFVDIKHDHTHSRDPNLYSMFHENVFRACLMFFQFFDALTRKMHLAVDECISHLTDRWIKTALMLYCTAVKLNCLIKI